MNLQFSEYKLSKIQKLRDAEKEVFKNGNYKNMMEVPFIEKIVLNSCFNKHKYGDDTIARAYKCFYLLTGLKPVFTRVKKSVSNFKIREKEILGIKVTLRGIKMIEFIERLVSIYLPKVKGMKKISNSNINKSGSFTIGIKEITNFPEITSDLSITRFGLSICFSLKKRNKKHVSPLEALELIKNMRIPTTISKN